MRIAIVGAGISGNLAARLLFSQHEVTLFESGSYAGGHANTVDVEVSGELFSVDTGFMVFNHKTYPNFCRLLDLLDVPSRASDMTFSVRDDATGLEYQGGTLNGLFAQRSNMLNPAFWRMLSDILRFNRLGQRAASDPNLCCVTLADFLRANRFRRGMVDSYLRPMLAAIWSCSPEEVDRFPLHFLLGFLKNHGLLQTVNQPRWRTLVGGSRQYVAALLQPLQNCVRLNSPVEGIWRHDDHVLIKTAAQPAEVFDQVVLATHADQSLRLLRDLDETEKSVLGAFPYQSNDAILHTDIRHLPTNRRARASWNYRVVADPSCGATVTYDLSRLQGHDSSEPILLTLNASQPIDATKVLRRFRYQHPAFRLETISAQQRHAEISGQRRTHFCGAYWGYGFHEDGVNSALAVAKHFGIEMSSCTVASTKERSDTSAANQFFMTSDTG